MNDTIRLTYKYRLYPTKSQVTALEEMLETCRLVYNSLLNNRKFEYEVNKKSISRYDQQDFLPVWKSEHEELTQTHSTTLQDVVKRVGLSFESFFRRIKQGDTPGYPRYKGKGQYDSITYVQSGFSFENGKLRLSKLDDICEKNLPEDHGKTKSALKLLGDVPIRLHRPIVGKIKNCTIRRSGSKWYACFSVEQPINYTNTSSEEIGIDVGITNFAALSDDTFIENPRFFRQEENNLAKVQRRFDRVKEEHGSKKRKKAKKAVSRIHERIRNRRYNFIHQATRRIVKKFGIIFLEKLNVKGMSKSPKPKPDPDNPGQYLPNGASAKAGLNKSIADVSWSMFREVLTYKAENAGGLVKAINPAYTSQMCRVCGYTSPENRKTQELFECTNPDPKINCKHSEHADTHASKNIKTIGHYSLAA